MNLPVAVRRRQRRQRVRYERLIVLAGPYAVSVVVTSFRPFLERAIAGLLAVFLVRWLARRPNVALIAIVVGLPIQYLLLSGLYEFGVPRGIVRNASLWKEAAMLALVVAAIRARRTKPRPADLLDRVIVGYLVVALLLLFVPGLLVGEPGASIAFGTRLNGFRTDAAYLLLFLACRHVRFEADVLGRAVRAFLVVALGAGALGIYEWAASGSWNTFVVDTLNLPRYKAEILNIQWWMDPYFFDIRVNTKFAGRTVLRIGGILVDYLQFGYWLCIGVALLLERQLRRQARAAEGLLVALLAVPILLTQTRSAVLGLVCVVLLTLRPLPGRNVAARTRLTVIAGMLAMLSLPLAAGIGLSQRITEGDETSDEGHSELSSAGIDTMLEEPLGRGLATAAGTGTRLAGEVARTTENQLLQVGTQLGVIGLGLWIAAFVGSVLALRREVVDGDGAPPAVRSAGAATMSTMVGLVPTMFFAQIYIYLPFSWTVWSLAGASLGGLEAHRARRAAGRYVSAGTAAG